MVSCLIRSASATVTLDDGAQIILPRRPIDPPERTVAAVTKLLCVDRFEFALTPNLRYGSPGSSLAVPSPSMRAF
jgi:hypothetical protein